MAKQNHPKVITANDLIEGDAVFLGPIGWVRDIAEARIAETADDVEMLEIAAAQAEADNLVVGAYLVDVTQEAGTIRPVKRREQIRAEGVPTIPVGPAAAVRLAQARAA